MLSTLNGKITALMAACLLVVGAVALGALVSVSKASRDGIEDLNGLATEMFDLTRLERDLTSRMFNVSQELAEELRRYESGLLRGSPETAPLDVAPSRSSLHDLRERLNGSAALITQLAERSEDPMSTLAEFAFIKRGTGMLDVGIELLAEANGRSVQSLQNGSVAGARANFLFEEAARVGSVEQLMKRMIDATDQMTNRLIESGRAQGLTNSAEIAGGVSMIAWTVGGVMFGLVIMALACGVVFLRRSVSKPIARTIIAMNALAEGDHEIELPDSGRSDEIGDIERALCIFRDGTRENRELSRKAADASIRAAEEQERKVKEFLNGSFGRTLAAASRGDFTNRVVCDSEDDSLNGLGERFNGMLEATASSLADITTMLGAMAQADLKHRITGSQQGSFAALRDDANGTADKLTDLVSKIRAGATVSLNEGKTIVEGNHNLARQTVSQAASLEETAASMEEIASTVGSNAEAAERAAMLATDVTEKARVGRKELDATLEAMSRIQKSSDQISEITNVIDGIAFQTNLLALNAAVEAARAGEAGKGFAVVASEVRALAQRSSEAAKDITQLIGESASRVADGVKLSTAARSVIVDAGDGVQQLTDLVTGIANASREQASTVLGINSSIGAIDVTTQENAALADKSLSAATQLLSELGDLEAQVGAFSVSDQDLSEYRSTKQAA